ncbi:DDE transposase, partial [bacterium]|nr:DDE transposase [bacterium]
SDLPRSPGHPFYVKLNKLLIRHGFDEFVEARCSRFYSDSPGRPSIPPGVDGSTLEANAAMRSIVRRDTGASYNEFLTDLAKESGIETPTREDLARLDRKRPKKTSNKTSNKDWRSPSDPDAKIAKMKDGRTHLGHKVEHAVDMETTALVAVTLQGADQGDTTTIWNTVAT